MSTVRRRAGGERALARFRVEAAGRDLDALLAELGGEPAGWFDDDTTETAEDVQ